MRTTGIRNEPSSVAHNGRSGDGRGDLPGSILPSTPSCLFLYHQLLLAKEVEESDRIVIYREVRFED